MSATPSSTLEVRCGLLAEQVPPGRPALLVTDHNVEPLVPTALATLPRHVLVPGEASKSWSELERLLLALDEARLDRDGVLLALGGGVVTDLAGMAASLHRRGIGWVALPTSLIGQVDAAVGGKTAVNLGGGKNTVGTFHPPQRVLVDPAALATLPERHLRAGLAEVLKTALIAGPDLYARATALRAEDFAAATEPAMDVIAGCLATKLELVEQDLTDRGPRRLLNLGHTFGHAFEALALPELAHGEAVALGLLCAARLGGEPGLEDELREHLGRWGLPVSATQDRERLLDEMGRDKKRADGRLTLIVPRAPGRVEIVEGVGSDPVRAALDAVLGPS